MKKHFDGVAFSFDKNEKAMIDDLNYSVSFATTHSFISDLEAYPYFSLKEVERIISAAIDNGQFGMIITDYDVSDFLHRVAVPHIASICSEGHKEILQRVIDEQKEREELNT